jgi:hypothetical protein
VLPTSCTSSDRLHEYRLWNADFSIGVLVDYEDYIEAIKHRWKTQKPCKKHRRMGYMCRNRAIRGTNMYYDCNGRKVRRREFETIYLHVWVLERSGKYRPPGCYLAEHVNGDIYDCRRQNLEWGTTQSNNQTRWDHARERRAAALSSGPADIPF